MDPIEHSRSEKMNWPVAKKQWVTDLPTSLEYHFVMYRKTSSISRTKFQNLNVSCILLQLSSRHPLKPGVKSRMKMSLEQRRQAMLQLHLSYQQFYCLVRCDLYERFYGNICIAKYDACAMMIFFNHLRVCMMVADDLMPIWCQDICNHHDDLGWLVHLRDSAWWLLIAWHPFGARPSATIMMT